MKKTVKNKFCSRCGCERRSLHRHHVIPKSQGGSNDSSNLVHICANCHSEVHGGPFGGRPGCRTGVCACCKREHWVQTHHIIPRSKGGTNKWSNLVDLCANCHEDVHGGSGWNFVHSDPELTAKRRAAIAAKWSDSEWKAKHLAEMREGLKGVDHGAKGKKASAAWDEEKRKAHSERIREIKLAKGTVISEEQRKQISETLKARYAAGEIVSPMMGKTTPPEVRAKQSLAARRRHAA